MAASTLEEIFDAWENRPAAGPASSDPDGKTLAEEDKNVYQMADEYVDAHSDDFVGWDNLPLKVLVKMVDEFRDSGDDENLRKVQVWLWHKFDPQEIGGEYHATIRTPANG